MVGSFGQHSRIHKERRQRLGTGTEDLGFVYVEYEDIVSLIADGPGVRIPAQVCPIIANIMVGFRSSPNAWIETRVLMSTNQQSPNSPTYTWFSREEMDRRWQAAQARMAERGIDYLLVSQEENFQYFAGSSASLALHQSLTRPSVLLLPASGDPIAITQGGPALEGTSHVSDVRDFHNLLDFPASLILDVLLEKGSTPGRIGAELGQEQRLGMPVGTYLNLVAALPNTEFVDAADIFIGLRMRKSAEELVYMREAAAITGRARQRLFDEIRPGMTEREVVRRMRHLLSDEGADRTGFVILQHDDPGARNQIPIDRALQPATVLAIDGGAYVGMYGVDYVRMATLGEASNTHRHVHAAVLEVVEKMKAALKPGIRCCDLFELTLQAIDESGCDHVEPERRGSGRVGHGQGILITEPPSLCATDETVIEPGMVISTEPGLRMGDVQFQWEDVHVVTDDGYEQLTLETSELRELDF